MVTFKNIWWVVLYAILLLVSIFLLLATSVYLKEQASITFQMYPYYMFIGMIYPLIGMLFGASHLINQRKKQGAWKVNLGKALVIGLPAFILGYYAILVFSAEAPLHFLSIPSVIFQKVMMTESTMHIFQILFGFIMITSFYKEGDESSI